MSTTSSVNTQSFNLQPILLPSPPYSKYYQSWCSASSSTNTSTNTSPSTSCMGALPSIDTVLPPSPQSSCGYSPRSYYSYNPRNDQMVPVNQPLTIITDEKLLYGPNYEFQVPYLMDQYGNPPHMQN